jgi:peptidoglycan L-alanyl-D-glutamate endopeptidase CwlK
MTLSARSLKNLEGVHSVLVRLVHKVAETAPPFLITEGRRTKERQAELVKRGKSKTMHSRHLTGHAIDFVAVVDGDISYDAAHMRPIADTFKTAAGELGIKITRGIDWGWDSPHIELERKAFPVDGPEAPIPADSAPIPVAAQPAASVAKPLVKSRTLWSIFAGGSFLTWLGDLVNQGMEIVTHAGAQFAALGPGREMLAMIGGNGSTIAWAVGVGCLVSAACARIDDSNKTPPKPEGEPA